MPSEIRDLTDPDEYEDGELDTLDLYCPKCGINDVRVIRLPNPAGWWSRFGEARCNQCRCKFPIRADAPPAQDLPDDYVFVSAHPNLRPRPRRR